MKLFSFAAVLAAAAICAAPVVAQVVLPIVPSIGRADVQPIIPNGFPSSQAVFATMLQQRSFTLAQNSQHLTTPTLTTSGSTCGGSTGTVSGTDVSGQIAEGSSASTSCVVTFATPYVTAPECFVSIDNVVDASLKCSASTTALTITKTSNASEKINYLIIGLSGG
jgi:hypothetical protein